MCIRDSYKGNQGCLSCLGKFAYACRDRRTHRTVGIRIQCELNLRNLLANVVSTMSHDDHDLFNATFAQVVDAAFDDGFVSEREQRLERAHTAGAAGGEKNSCDLSH